MGFDKVGIRLPIQKSRVQKIGLVIPQIDEQVGHAGCDRVIVEPFNGVEVVNTGIVNKSVIQR